MSGSGQAIVPFASPANQATDWGACSGRRRATIVPSAVSIQAYQPSPTLIPYSTTKGAILTFTKALSDETIKQGIRVNAVAPWYIRTRRTSDALAQPDYYDEVIARTPMRRVLAVPSVVLESAVGAFMLAVAAWFWFESYSIETRAPSSLSGPVAFPRGIAAMLAVCSVLFVWRTVVARIRTGRSRDIPVERPAAVLASMVLVVLYPLMLEWLGFYVATGAWRDGAAPPRGGR